MARVGLLVAVLAWGFLAVVNAEQGPKNPPPVPTFLCEQATHGPLLTMGDVFNMLLTNYRHLSVTTETLKTYMAYADDDRDNMLSKEECEKLLKHLNTQDR